MTRVRAKYVAIQAASARGVAERWRSQYQHPKDGWSASQMATGKTTKEIFDGLVALGPLPDIERAAEIIGNKSWTHVHCDGCGDYVTRAVSIGEYEPKSYCPTCVTEAASILEQQQ